MLTVFRVNPKIVLHMEGQKVSACCNTFAAFVKWAPRQQFDDGTVAISG